MFRRRSIKDTIPLGPPPFRRRSAGLVTFRFLSSALIVVRVGVGAFELSNWRFRVGARKYHYRDGVIIYINARQRWEYEDDFQCSVSESRFYEKDLAVKPGEQRWGQLPSRLDIVYGSSFRKVRA